jgi:hypothetical protein
MEIRKILKKPGLVDFVLFLLILLLAVAAYVSLMPRKDSVPVIARSSNPLPYLVEIVPASDTRFLFDRVQPGDSNEKPRDPITVVEKIAAENDKPARIVLLLSAGSDEQGNLFSGMRLLRPGESFRLQTRKYTVGGIIYAVRPSPVPTPSNK